MPIDLTVKNGVLVLPEGIMKGDVAVDEGKIVAVGSSAVFPKA